MTKNGNTTDNPPPPPPPKKTGRQADRILNMVKKFIFLVTYTILPKVLGQSRLMNRFDYFSNLQKYKS